MTKEIAASAGVWSAIDLSLRHGVQFAVSLILARLLMPADFGIAALVIFFAGLSIVFVQGGLSAALIQRRETSAEEESAVFWWNLIASIIFGLLIVAVAPAVSNFYGHPVIAPLMVIAAVQVVFSAAGAIQIALLSRTLRFDQLTKAGVIATLVSGAIGIGAALSGAGVWALLLQLSSAAAISSGAMWVLCPWRPILHFRFQTIRPLFHFGWALSVSSALDVLYTQGFALIVARQHGVSDLGIYNRAQNTQLLPSNFIGSLVGRVAMPIFARRTDEPDALRRGVQMANSLTMLVNVPTMIGLVILSDLVMICLFGAKWLPAAPVLSILALSGILYPLHVINLQLLLAQGRSRAFLRLETIKKLVGIGSIVIGSLFGIEGLAWSQAIFGVFALWLNASPTARSISYGSLAQLRDLSGIFSITLIMGGMILTLRPMLDLSPLVELLVLSSAGALFYALAGLLLRIPHFVQALTLARSLIKKRAKNRS